MSRSGPARAVPPAVLALAGGSPLRLAWENEVGGLTFELGSDPQRRFVKWVPRALAADLDAEAARMGWARAFTAVPSVLDRGSDDAGSWLVTAALAGSSAVSDRWRAEPERAVRALGRGLRSLHDSLPVGECPFAWSIEDRVARACRGVRDPQRWSEVYGKLSVPEARDLLSHPPAIDRLVVCQGDACAPNTLIDDSGGCSGHVDLGALGVADRWADLAIATWSTEWNYGPGWEDHLLDSYGVAPDPERTRYYRLLWDAEPDHSGESMHP